MKADPFKQADFSGGMITNANVSICPPNTVALLQNWDPDEILGSLVSRLGSSTVGAQLVSGKSVLGLYQHIDSANASNNKLFATINASNGLTSVIYDVLAGTTSVTGLTASKKMRYLTFLGATLAINGSDAERSYTSSGWITTGGAFDLANVPGSNACNLCISFLDRVYLGGDSANPTRVYYSGLSNGTAVSWTSGNGYIDIENSNNAGALTAFAKVPGYVLFFKERAMHRWNFSSAFPELLIQIGTPSQESVIMGGGLCAFYSNSNENAKGFYVTNGDRPQAISHDTNRPIKRWIDAIPAANEANIAGYATDRHFCWSVGDLTVDGESYTNVHLRWNRLNNQWSVRTYPKKHKVFAQYLVSGSNAIIAGDDDGYVARIDAPGVFTDYPSAAPIPVKVRTHAQTFASNRKKSIGDEIAIRATNFKDFGMTAIADDKRIPMKAPSFLSGILGLFKVSEPVKGTAIALEIAGKTQGARSYLHELEVPTIDIDQTFV